MLSQVYWIPSKLGGRLGIMARPRGDAWLVDEIAALREAGVQVLVSLLMPVEQWELQLEDEAGCCLAHGVTFIALPIPDRDVPVLGMETVTFIAGLVQEVQNGQTVVVHCRQGVGRASLIAGCVLVMMGEAVATVWSTLAAARGCPVPDTAAQRAWLDTFAAQWRWFANTADSAWVGA